MNEKFRTVGQIVLASIALGVSIFSYLHFSETGAGPRLADTYAGMLLSIFIGYLVCLATYLLNKLLNKLLPWRGTFAGRFLVGYVVISIAAALIIIGTGAAAIQLFGASVLWKDFNPDDDDVLWKLGILILVCSFIYNVVYTILYAYKQFAVAQVESIQQERKQLELQFEALKSQLSPHYLFNSLNTISSLLYNDPKTAEQFIRRLALTYQYILSTQHKKHVMLMEEIEFVQSYYYLLKIRFQQALTLEVNLPNSVLNSPIPPLTLQLLVENAVKHNTVNPERPLFIYISAVDNTQLKVTNTKNDSEQAAASFRIGLENIRKRYQFFTDKKIEVKDDDKFVVTLPVLKVKPVISNFTKPVLS